MKTKQERQSRKMKENWADPEFKKRMVEAQKKSGWRTYSDIFYNKQNRKDKF